MEDGVIKRTNTNKIKTVNHSCLNRRVMPEEDELTPKEREDLETMIALPYT